MVGPIESTSLRSRSANHRGLYTPGSRRVRLAGNWYRGAQRSTLTYIVAITCAACFSILAKGHAKSNAPIILGMVAGTDELKTGGVM